MRASNVIRIYAHASAALRVLINEVGGGDKLKLAARTLAQPMNASPMWVGFPA